MELAILLAEVAQVVNSRPIARSKPVEDPTGGRPITLLHHQLGRASIEVPEVTFYLSPSLTKRLYHDKIKMDFWKKWMAQVFQGKVLAQ
jgi:hypothetical protein